MLLEYGSTPRLLHYWITNEFMTMNKVFSIFIELLDPLMLVPKKVKKRLEQEEEKRIKVMAVINHVIPTLVYPMLFFLLDYNKPNIKMWEIYRFGLAIIIGLLGLSSYLLRKNKQIIVANIYLVALCYSLANAWSMTFVPGLAMATKWIVIVSALLLTTVSSGLIFPILWLLFITTISPLLVTECT